MLWQDFVADIERRVVVGDPDSLFAAQDAFQTGIAAGALTNIFNESLSDQKSASKRLVFGNNGSVTLHRSEIFSINLMFFKGHLENLYYEPLHNITVLANKSELEATRFRVVDAGVGTGINKDSTLVEIERNSLHEGDMWAINGRSEVSDLNSVNAECPLLATLSGVKLGGLCWTFDRAKLTAWYATSIDYEVTSMVTIADLLGRLRDRTALEPLSRLYDESPHHYARWSAVKNIGLIDKKLGIDFLKRSLRDPHPEVRQAAERTLTRHGLL